MSKFKSKSNLKHKLRIFEIVILNTKKAADPAKTCVQKNLRTPNCRCKFTKNLLTEKRKENM